MEGLEVHREIKDRKARKTGIYFILCVPCHINCQMISNLCCAHVSHYRPVIPLEKVRINLPWKSTRFQKAITELTSQEFMACLWVLTNRSIWERWTMWASDPGVIKIWLLLSEHRLTIGDRRWAQGSSSMLKPYNWGNSNLRHPWIMTAVMSSKTPGRVPGWSHLFPALWSLPVRKSREQGGPNAMHKLLKISVLSFREKEKKSNNNYR